MEHEKTRCQLLIETASLRSKLATLESIARKHVSCGEYLGESAARYRAMIEAFDGLIYICSRDFRIEFMNRHFIERTGFNGTGELCFKIVYGRDSVCPWCVNERVFRGETVKWEILSPLDNRWYYVVDVPIYRRDGIVSKQAMILDIDDLKRAEEALKKSEAKYRSLFDDSMDAICIVDGSGRFQDFNRAAEELFGYSRAEMLNEVNVEVLFADSSDVQRFRHLVEEKGAIKDFQVRLRKKDGNTMHCLISSSVKRSADSKVTGYQGIIRDVTRYRKAEEDLRQGEKKTRLFAYSISHDLKSPAIALYGLARRFKGHVEGLLDERGLTYCNHILSAAQQIAQMADQINTFIATQVTPLNMEKVVIEDVVAMLKDEFSGRLKIKGVKMTYPSAMPQVWADRMAVLRILRNLIDNALKYGGEDMEEIRVGCYTTDEYNVVSVMDDGVTIRKEDLKTIFETFGRIENKKGVTGTGLGLGIVRELAQRHGGGVWVESNEGKGKTFFVSFRRNPCFES